MRGRFALLFFVLVVLTGILAFAPIAGMSAPVALTAEVLFLIFLVPLIIALFDVIGESFRGPS